MERYLHAAMLAAMVAVLACSGPTPTTVPEPTATPVPTATPSPTATPVPTATPAPTATPVPTATPAPTLTPGPEEKGTSERIAPLSMGDPDALMTQISAGELQCLVEGMGLPRLMELQEDPGLATPEETKKAIDCLGDESALRAFLTELMRLTGPLSPSTSDCLRTGFETFDVRSVMLAMQVAEHQRKSQASSASAFILTLSCLNEEEWRIYIPPMIMQREEQGRLRCVVETLGGTRELAAELQASGEGATERLLEATDRCGMRNIFIAGR